MTRSFFKSTYDSQTNYVVLISNQSETLIFIDLILLKVVSHDTEYVQLVLRYISCAKDLFLTPGPKQYRSSVISLKGVLGILCCTPEAW